MEPVVTENGLDFVLKIASRCNLNCTYCYVYNKGDDTWRNQPSVMSDEVFELAIARIDEFCNESGQRAVKIIFHGGEPTLVGVRAFERMCVRIREHLARREVFLSLQTNATLLDDAWAAVIKANDVGVGISIDGPAEVHDRARVYHSGGGSHAGVLRGIAALRDAGIELHFLTVMQLGSDPVCIHQYLVDCGARTINYLFPDYCHDDIGQVRAVWGTTPCADFMLPIFARELEALGEQGVRVPLIRTLARLILGGESDMDVFGNTPLRYLFITSGGAVEALDVLRVCGNGACDTGLNVRDHAISELRRRSRFHDEVVFTGMPLPKECVSCPERDVCGGGYLPHRYSRGRGFENASVWCEDILAMLAYLRAALGVDHDETQMRRTVLHDLRVEALRATGATG
jgi:uncharacterized protein